MNNGDQGQLAGELDEGSLIFLQKNRVNEILSEPIKDLTKNELSRYIFRLKNSLRALENTQRPFLKDDEDYQEKKEELMEEFKTAPLYEGEQKDKIDLLTEWYDEIIDVMNENNIYFGTTTHYSVRTNARKKELEEKE